jgi:hypothetical protein
MGEVQNDITLSLNKMEPKKVFADLSKGRTEFVDRAVAVFRQRIASLQYIGDEIVQKRKNTLEDHIRKDLTVFFDENQSRCQILHCSAVLVLVRDEVRALTLNDIDRYFDALKKKLMARNGCWNNDEYQKCRSSFVASAKAKFDEATKAVTTVATFRTVLVGSTAFQTQTQELCNSVSAHFSKSQTGVANSTVAVRKVFEGFAEKPSLFEARRYRWRDEGHETYPLSDWRARYRYVYIQSHNYGRGRIFSNVAPGWGEFVPRNGPSLADEHREVGWTYEERSAWSST